MIPQVLGDIYKIRIPTYAYILEINRTKNRDARDFLSCSFAISPFDPSATLRASKRRMTLNWYKNLPFDWGRPFDKLTTSLGVCRPRMSIVEVNL